MSAIAEPPAALIDDRLAKRNAVVLAVAQALAGGNNTVIVATAGIIGLVLAPDKSLATLPISVMMFGLWFSTVPMGLMARSYGRRTALQIGTTVGAVSGLICCVAVLQGSFPLLLVGTFGCGFYAAGHMSYRFAVDRHGKRCLQADRDLLRAGRRRAGWRDRPFGRDLHQGSVAALSVRRDVHRAGGAGRCSRAWR